jgi:hypothetical protein
VQGGDISNEISPRVLVIANDFLVHPPKGFEVLNSGRRFGKWERVAKRYEIDDDVRAWLHDFTWRRAYRVDCVFVEAPDAFATAMAARFDRINLAIANTYAMPSLKLLVQSLAYMPEVKWVLHGRPDWGLAFGPRAACGIAGLREVR